MTEAKDTKRHAGGSTSWQLGGRSQLVETLNRSLDKLALTRIHLLRRPWPSYQVCGLIGLAAAILLASGLALHLDLSLLVIAGMAAAAALTFLGLVMATKIITGEERIIYYHHEIAVMIVTALLLRLWSKPLLPYLDIAMLGVGMFLVCGRIGCLMVGCCHGRPHVWGVRYRTEHAEAGFTHYFVGVRLFPIQVVESLWVLCTVLIGSAFVLRDYPGGTALTFYVVVYGWGRFCFEFFRGDPERPFLWGFSQPQWLSLILMGVTVWAEVSGRLPFHSLDAAAAVCMAVVMVSVSLMRRFQQTGKHRLLDPVHVQAVAHAVETVSNLATEKASLKRWTVFPTPRRADAGIHIASTSLGIQISASRTDNTATGSLNYSLSKRDGNMTEREAGILARLILQLRQASGGGKVVKGNLGVFHLVIQPGTLPLEKSSGISKVTM